MSDSPLVQLKRVRKRFGEQLVLDGINLKFSRGEVVVIAGPAGAGKTTLLRIINGLVPVDSGEVRFEGRLLPRSGATLAHVRRQIGMVFQHFNLIPHKSVLENVTLAPVEVKGLSRPQANRAARRLLERVGIGDVAYEYPGELSDGQQQRVAIARALAMEPKLMLFDEPTSSLDPSTIRPVLDVMRDLARDGMSMAVVTHEMGFAREVGDHMVFIDGGRIVAQAPPRELFEAARKDYARQLR
jgi:ABC-type polar amino acid transport system ATPase subunit